MKYKAIIFDMDGTIADTEPIWLEATKLLIKNKGKHIDSAQLMKLEKEILGNCTSKSCEVIKKAINIQDSIDDLVKEKSKLAWGLYNKDLKFIKGFLEFHKKVQDLKLLHAVATNADDKSLHLTKQFLNLEQLFGKHIYNASHVKNRSKPRPDIYLFAAKQLNVDPNHCIAIEDSSHGIKAAKKAGMYCIGINSTGKPDLLKKADMIIDHYDQVDLERLLKH